MSYWAILTGIKFWCYVWIIDLNRLKDIRRKIYLVSTTSWGRRQERESGRKQFSIQGQWLDLKQVTVRLIAPVFQEVKIMLSSREAQISAFRILNLTLGVQRCSKSHFVSTNQNDWKHFLLAQPIPPLRSSLLPPLPKSRHIKYFKAFCHS